MLGRLARERFLLYLLVCSVLGFTAGCTLGLLIYVILTWQHISVFVLSVLSGGG